MNKQVIKNEVWERERERESRKAHYYEFQNITKFEDKIAYSKSKIKDFLICIDKKNYEEKQEQSKIIVSFSGGKDSTVLLDLIVKAYLEIENKFKTKIIINIGYAYEITFPETRKFIIDTFNNLKNTYDFIGELIFEKPKLPWNEILETKGFPIFSKQISVHLNRIKKVKSNNNLAKWIFKINTVEFGLSKNRLFLLDDRMKDFPTSKNNPNIDEQYFNLDILLNNRLKDKNIFERYQNYYSEKCCYYIKGGLKKVKLPMFLGTMASESLLRKKSWIDNGCNIINEKKQISRPLSIWNEIDIWRYIIKNNVAINKMYGFNKNKNIKVDDKKEIVNLINKLNYKRLGCTSCPYGSHLEKDKNRFEILFTNTPILYKSQVISNGIYKVLIDMNIKINDDKKYMILYYERQNQIKEWYENIYDNIFEVIAQIENYKNYKQYNQDRWKKCSWVYTIAEIKQILNNYDIKIPNSKNLTEEEIDQIILDKITNLRKIKYKLSKKIFKNKDK